MGHANNVIQWSDPRVERLRARRLARRERADARVAPRPARVPARVAGTLVLAFFVSFGVALLTPAGR